MHQNWDSLGRVSLLPFPSQRKAGFLPLRLGPWEPASNSGRGREGEPQAWSPTLPGQVHGREEGHRPGGVTAEGGRQQSQ